MNLLLFDISVKYGCISGRLIKSSILRVWMSNFVKLDLDTTFAVTFNWSRNIRNLFIAVGSLSVFCV